MPQELDAKEIEHLALKQVGILPQVHHRRHHIAAVHLLCDGAHGATLVVDSVFKNVYTPETLFPEVLADDSNKVVEMLPVLQLCHLCGEVLECEFYVVKFHVLYLIILYSFLFPGVTSQIAHAEILRHVGNDNRLFVSQFLRVLQVLVAEAAQTTLAH